MSLPIRCLGSAAGTSVERLGKIVHDRPAFHTEHFIFPAGFQSRRSDASCLKPGGGSVEYVSEVLDTGGAAPLFRVTATDNPLRPVDDSSPDGVWSKIWAKLGRQPPPAGFGATLFGLADARVERAILALDNAAKCARFVPRAQRLQHPGAVPEKEPAVKRETAGGMRPDSVAPPAQRPKMERGLTANALKGDVTTEDLFFLANYVPSAPVVLPSGFADDAEKAFFLHAVQLACSSPPSAQDAVTVDRQLKALLEDNADVRWMSTFLRERQQQQQQQQQQQLQQQQQQQQQHHQHPHQPPQQSSGVPPSGASKPGSQGSFFPSGRRRGRPPGAKNIVKLAKKAMS